jgi:hypothetical protein
MKRWKPQWPDMSKDLGPQSSQRYIPRFELWVNVFFHQALMNCVNSLASFEVTTQAVQGVMIAEAKIPLDRLVWNVKILDALLIDKWKEKDTVADWDKMVQDIDINEAPDKYLHQIMSLLMKRGMLRFKPPRSLAD